MTIVEALISDISAAYNESGVKMIDKFGTDLNIMISMINDKITNFLRDVNFRYPRRSR